MKISELSRRSGVPTSTIKFYIRSGLVPAGELSHRNQAQYGEEHLKRVDLIRALRDIAGLPIDVVQTVLEQTDKPWGEKNPVGAALEAIYPAPERDRSGEEQTAYDGVRTEVAALLHSLPWVRQESVIPPNYSDHFINIVADGVLQMRRYVEPDFPVERLRDLAAVIWLMSEAVVVDSEDTMPRRGDDLVDPTRTAVIGTLLLSPLILALMRLANTMRYFHVTEEWPLPRPHLEDINT
jgi:DNA-binding transcriptional MerR regulator